MQKLQLTIPEPCHENWQQMTPTEQGRYCNTCAKEVIDFSMMTDTEVLNYFTHITHDKVCGRALPSQLDRTITLPKEPKKRLFWYWNYIVMFLMFFSKSNNAKAQGDIKAATEFSPVKPADVNKVETIVMSSWIVKGKVVDVAGNPIGFATIKIKRIKGSISTDANGNYSVWVATNSILVISALGFKEMEVPVGENNVLNITLERKEDLRGEVVITNTGGIKRTNIEKDRAIRDARYSVDFQVKDDKYGQAIAKAKIIIAKNKTNEHDTVFSDKNGSYTLKGIRYYESFFIKVEADGYEGNEFTISPDDFKDKKKVWEVSLKIQNSVLPKSLTALKLGPANTVRLRCESAFNYDVPVLYVVDGVIDPCGDKITTDDIEDSIVLQGPSATALFGPDGANGAIVITTRKTKVKDLKEVVIVSDYGIRRTAGMVGSFSVIEKTSIFNEAMARINTLVSDSIKVYPNPVETGTSFNISLKLKQTGNHQIQIADAAGRTILQKQINAAAKEYKEIINADTKWSGGVYYIRVFGNKNQLISKSSFIVR